MATASSRIARAATLVVACTALFLIFLDSTVVNVALPTLQRELAASVGLLEWAVNGYIVAFAGLVLLGAGSATGSADVVCSWSGCSCSVPLPRSPRTRAA
jgi:hypothetical protein